MYNFIQFQMQLQRISLYNPINQGAFFSLARLKKNPELSHDQEGLLQVQRLPGNRRPSSGLSSVGCLFFCLDVPDRKWMDQRLVNWLFHLLKNGVYRGYNPILVPPPGPRTPLSLIRV